MLKYSQKTKHTSRKNSIKWLNSHLISKEKMLKYSRHEKQLNCKKVLWKFYNLRCFFIKYRTIYLFFEDKKKNWYFSIVFVEWWPWNSFRVTFEDTFMIIALLFYSQDKCPRDIYDNSKDILQLHKISVLYTVKCNHF